MNEALLSRVKKLLALATSNNVYEAASAARAAQVLIDRHHLQDALVDDGDDDITDGREAPLEVAKRPRRWRFGLADGIARANGGLCWSVEGPAGTQLCFCGRADDRVLVAALFEHLATRIEWLSASAGPGRPRQWHEAFRVGAADAITERLTNGVLGDDLNGDALDAVVDAVVDGAHGTDDADTRLQRISDRRQRRSTAATRYLEARVRFGKGRRYSVDARGFAKGKAAGQALPLHQADTHKR